MKKYKHFLLSSLAVFFLLLLVHFVPLIIVDPLSITRVNILKKEFFVKEMRFQVAGIINNFDFNSAIVGTSMAENFNAEEASYMLGGTFMNLSLSGSLLKERKVVLDYLLSNKKIKTLIVSLDGSTEFQRNAGIPIKAWSFLYNDNYWDDFTVYTNRKYMPYINCHSMFQNSIISLLFGECPTKKIRNDISSLTEWQSNPEHNSRFGGIENWINHKNNGQVKASINKIINSNGNIAANVMTKKPLSMPKIYDYKQFEQNIIPLVRDNIEIRFILFFPPYSIFEHAINYRSPSGVFNNYIEFVKKVVFEMEKYSNAEVYWFNNDEFVNNIANYKDLTHYNGSFNTMFLKNFSERKSIINYTNYIEIISDFQQRVKEVNLHKFAEKFNDNNSIVTLK